MSNIHRNDSPKDSSILLPLIKELNEMFSQFFDQTWFYILIDNTDIEQRTLSDILSLLSQEYKLVENNEKLTDLTLLLSKLYSEVSQQVLPVIRERLRISGFQKENIEFGDNEYIRRVLIAKVFPDNLKRLEEIIKRLRNFMGLAELPNNDDETMPPHHNH
ncbi:MAG: hypothetical protein JXR70_19160 [Spirochaetales bacterium]|nr:hypothetical protein [Spirochaetales bacterium]